MNNLVDPILRIIISITCFLYAMYYMQRKDEATAAGSFAAAQFFFGVWTLLDAVKFFTGDNDTLPWLQSFTYIIAEFSAYSLFRFSVRYSISDKLRNKKTLLIPAGFLFLTIILFLVVGNKLFIDPESPAQKGISVLETAYMYHKNPWYFIHVAYCYLLVAVSMGFLIYRSVSRKQIHRKQYILVAVAVIFFIIQSVDYFTRANFIPSLMNESLDVLNAVCIMLVVNFSFFAMYFDQDENIICRCRKSLFETAGIPILVFNSCGEMLLVNKLAEAVITHGEKTFRKYTQYEELFPSSEFQRLGIPQSRGKDSLFYLSKISSDVIYLCTKINMYNFWGKPQGFMITMYNLKEYNVLVQDLQTTAYTDNLTGCMNRNAFFVNLLAQLHHFARPVILVSAALDNLSDVNNVLGHDFGDEYIKETVRILRASGSDIEIYRMESSVFVFILPDSKASEIPEMFRKIRAECTLYSKNKPYPLVISVGYTVIENLSCDLNAAYNAALKNMVLDRKGHSGR